MAINYYNFIYMRIVCNYIIILLLLLFSLVCACFSSALNRMAWISSTIGCWLLRSRYSLVEKNRFWLFVHGKAVIVKGFHPFQVHFTRVQIQMHALYIVILVKNQWELQDISFDTAEIDINEHIMPHNAHVHRFDSFIMAFFVVVDDFSRLFECILIECMA